MNPSELSAEHRRYLKMETVISAVANAAISALFAWLFFREIDAVPLWGGMGMAVDFIPTVFMITLVTGLITTTMTRKRVRDGVIAPLAGTGKVPLLGLAWPRNTALRSLLMAVLAAAILVPLSIGAMVMLAAMQMAFLPFVVFKVVYGAAVTVLVAPALLKAALADAGIDRGVTTAAVRVEVNKQGDRG